MLKLLALALLAPTVLAVLKELPRRDDSGASGDTLAAPPTCTPKLLGNNLEAAAHDLLQSAEPQTSAACAALCCAIPKCGGALFEPISAVTYHACKAGAPCCFLKTSVADHQPMAKPVKGGADLWVIPGRQQDDEKLTFLSVALGSHMVLQRAPQQALLWGFTKAGSTVTTTLTPSGGCETNALNTVAGCEVRTLSTTADAKGTWRQKLPATPASKKTFSLSLSSSSPLNETATM
jgi:hypothetical protein